MKFKSIVLDRMDRTELRVYGFVKIGMKGKERESKFGKKFRPPQKLDHFRITLTHKDKDENYVINKDLMAKLDKYKDDDGYDIAKYLRDNEGNPQAESKLLDIFPDLTKEEINEVKQYNRDNFGTGMPEHVPKGRFMAQYYKDKGWEYKPPPAHDPGHRELNKYKEAEKAYYKEYGAPMTLGEYERNYFMDKGWTHLDEMRDLRSSDEEGYKKWLKEAPVYRERADEAIKSYTDKFGYEPVVTQVAENIGDWTIPGLYVARNWNELSTADKAINIAVDVVFLAAIFRLPKVTVGGFKIVKARIAPRCVKIIDNISDRLSQSIRAGDSILVRQEARNMIKLGESMRKVDIPGGDSLIRRGMKYWRKQMILSQ